MEWNDVRIFLAVARSGSFGESARMLDVSHPTVGRRIKVLEDEAKQPLFRRTKDGLVLTDAGDTVLALAESMEDAAVHGKASERQQPTPPKASCGSHRRTGLPAMYWLPSWPS